MTIGIKIKELRKRKGITQKELAEELNITDSAITRYESGKREPNIDMINKIAAALGVSINELLLDSVVNLSDMTKEDKENYIDLIIEYPEFKSLIELIEKQGYRVNQKMMGSDIILTKNDEIISKIPPKDFIDFGKDTLKFINEFSEFELSKLIDIYSLLS